MHAENEVMRKMLRDWPTFWLQGSRWVVGQEKNKICKSRFRQRIFRGKWGWFVIYKKQYFGRKTMVLFDSLLTVCWQFVNPWLCGTDRRDTLSFGHNFLIFRQSNSDFCTGCYFATYKLRRMHVISHLMQCVRISVWNRIAFPKRLPRAFSTNSPILSATWHWSFCLTFLLRDKILFEKFVARQWSFLGFLNNRSSGCFCC
jgi:hypothetical protein